MELLEELHRDGATIVMVTHDPELAVRAQRQVRIMDGRIVEFIAEPHLIGSADGASRRALAGLM